MKGAMKTDGGATKHVNAKTSLTSSSDTNKHHILKVSITSTSSERMLTQSRFSEV
jgi:hypothetical protein